MNIRSLQLSREVVIFLVVTTLMSIFYLVRNTGEHTAPHSAISRTSAELAEGKTSDVAITLVTDDMRSLSCASDELVGTAHCAFNADGSKWETKHPDAPRSDADVIMPYMTADNVMLMVAGLWVDPALQKRVGEEPPGSKPRDELRRFNANCKLKVDKKLKASEFKVRWSGGGAFGNPSGDAPVGHVSACSTVDTG